MRRNGRRRRRALPEQVSKVMVDFAYSIGLFATADLSGLDIGYDSRQRRAAQNPNYRKLPIADAIVEAGRLGQKTSAGWFRYEKGDRTPHPDPEAARIIKEKAAEIGIEQRSFTGEEILRRLLFASVNEACKMLDEGKAHRASDIDVMWLNGLRLPALPQRPDVLGRWHRRRRGLSPDRRLAPALRRTLGPLSFFAPVRRNRHPVPRGETEPADVALRSLSASWN
jgi:3-hydroxyacyl-CoA dehydrogenase